MGMTALLQAAANLCWEHAHGRPPIISSIVVTAFVVSAVGGDIRLLVGHRLGHGLGDGLAGGVRLVAVLRPERCPAAAEIRGRSLQRPRNLISVTGQSRGRHRRLLFQQVPSWPTHQQHVDGQCMVVPVP